MTSADVGRRTRLAAAAVAVALLPAPASAAADTAPPVIDAITFQPSTPVVYSAVAFTATAHDAESGVASLSWAFGDGGTAVGPSVSHTYTQSGTMTVTVTALDTAGNAATATAQVPVSGFQPEPSYTEPTITRLRVRPSTISLGRTPGVARRTAVTFRLSELYDSTRLRIVLRGPRHARATWDDVDEGRRTLRLSTVRGDRHRVLLPVGRYVVVVRASNRYGTEVEKARLRIVR